MKRQEKDKPGLPGIGERFQEETKYTPAKLAGHYLDWSSMPDRYKDCAEAIRKVPLPDPQIDKTEKFWDVISRRRSMRHYTAAASLSIRDLAMLLWATQGITAASSQFEFRSAPSAGGLYPIETYLMCRNVETLEPGIYHFRPHEFDLELIKAGDFGVAFANAALGQSMVSDAPVCFIWTALVQRSKWKYRQRAYRYIYLDAGHIAQNLYLAGTAINLGVCGIGAFFDDHINNLLGVDGVEETVVYLASLGRPDR
ncbi:MAG: SagB/ThcOx family dehydrogenase [Acidobacteriota bacterium]